MVIVTPWVFFLLFRTVVDLSRGKFDGAAFPVGATYALCSLAASIAVAPANLRRASKWILALGLIVGLLIVVRYFYDASQLPLPRNWDGAALLADWGVVGSAIVAIWNLMLLSKKFSFRFEVRQMKGGAEARIGARWSKVWSWSGRRHAAGMEKWNRRSEVEPLGSVLR